MKTIGITGLILLMTVSMSMLYAAEGDKGTPNKDAEQMQKMMIEGIRRQLGSTTEIYRILISEMMERTKKQLAPTDEEWTVIEPRLSKVIKLSAENSLGGLRTMFGSQGGRDKSGVEKVAEELQTVLKSGQASPSEITDKLTSLRKQKEKVQSELITAKSELRDILTLEQEATLVIMGLLD